jgi:bifunctional enzyme CysN/CysC
VAETELLRLLTAGSVDDGKSTLIGRLLYDSRALPDDHVEGLARDSARRSSAGGAIDYSLLVDGLQAEREQGITIDVAYRYFATARRKFIIADTPGHEQYTRNMATGASTADLAIILVDARQGVVAQTKRHSYIASLLGIRHLVVAVNKMDLVGYDEAIFEKIRAGYARFAARLDVADLCFIPMSALHGDNVVERSARMPWYAGAPLLQHLETVHIASDRNLADLRFPVQYVLRPDLTFRGFAGTVAAGVLRTGDAVVVLPSGVGARVRALASGGVPVDEAAPPMAITVQLEEEVDVARGDMLVRADNLPHREASLAATVVWMSPQPLRVGKGYLFKHTTRTVAGEAVALQHRVDVHALEEQPAEELGLNEIGQVHFKLARPLFFDAYQRSRATGSFIVIDRMSNATVGAGMMLERQPGALVPSGRTLGPPPPIDPGARSQVAPAERAARRGHRGVALWVRGLPKAGKSTIAFAVERRLVDAGFCVLVLDAYDLRQGVSRDLSYSADDRSENSRRAAEIARLAVEQGLITIGSLTAPYAADRARARATIGADAFLEVYLTTPLAVCEARAREIFARARSGELPNFTGVSAPYEPGGADLELPAHELSVDACVDRVVELLRARGFLG